MIAFLNAAGVAIGIALMIRGLQLEDWLRGGVGVLLVVVYLVKLVRECCDDRDSI